MSASEFAAHWNELETEADRRSVLLARCRGDRELFALTFFDERIEAGWSPLHREFLGRPKVAWRERTDRAKYATAAPRGNAKSTIVSFIDVAHDVVYAIEKFVIEVSTDFGLSKDLVADLYALFKDASANRELHAVYGPITVHGGETDFRVVTPDTEASGVRILAGSANGTVRGKKHAGTRPTRVILDDLEHPKHVLSPEHRAYVWSWVNGDVLKGGRPGTIYDFLGTVLHPEAALARALKDPGWKARRWQSVIAWPSRSDLWDACRLVWANLDDPEREATARAFYEANRPAMDTGAEVLWPEYEPLFDLMVLLWSDGVGAFYRDKQNDPRDPERMIFDVERFARCSFDGLTIQTAEVRALDGKVLRPSRAVPVSDCELAHWLDPSLGKATSDFPALATVARERRTGYRFVLHCSMDKGPPSSQRARVWSLFDRYHRGKFGTDETGLGALFDEGYQRERKDREREGRLWNLPVRGHTLSDDKIVRIARLEPDTLNGWIQFATDLPPIVLEQFRDFPTGANDDAPDAIERADWLLGANMPTITPQTSM